MGIYARGGAGAVGWFDLEVTREVGKLINIEADEALVSGWLIWTISRRMGWWY